MRLVFIFQSRITESLSFFEAFFCFSDYLVLGTEPSAHLVEDEEKAEKAASKKHKKRKKRRSSSRQRDEEADDIRDGTDDKEGREGKGRSAGGEKAGIHSDFHLHIQTNFFSPFEPTSPSSQRLFPA